MERYLIFYRGEHICTLSLTEEAKRKFVSSIEWTKSDFAMYKAVNFIEQKH